MAAHQAGPDGDHRLRTLIAAEAPRLEVLVGHDTKVTALAAALGADHDAAPGGALVMARRRDARGSYVTLSCRVQPLGVIRNGTATVIDRPIAIPGCAKRCPLDRFDKLLRAKLAPVVAE